RGASFMARKLVGVWAGVVIAFGAACYGQDTTLADLYGRGVHAFFANRTPERFDFLNAAVLSGSRDPRTFYFRGLALSRMGGSEDAKNDFRLGAEFEFLRG